MILQVILENITALHINTILHRLNQTKCKKSIVIFLL